MKALVYDGIQKVDYREVTDPKIEKDDDIIVKVTSTAICGSDLHLVHGLVKGMYDGFVLGHETMGIVEEVGKEVKNLKKGDRVIIPFPVSCGRRTRAVLVMDSGHIILSAIQPETLASRIDNNITKYEIEED